MYLAKLTIAGFRKLHELELTFRPGLNVLIGPNNVGKTAVVDSLRALLSSTDEGALRVDEYDLHIDGLGNKARCITFEYIFRDLSDDEEADFHTALKPEPSVSGGATKYEAHLTVRYDVISGGRRLRPKRWCGDHEENAVTSDMLENLRAVYLQPLRDPASGLRPSRSSQLARLIEMLADDVSKTDIVQMLNNFEDTLAKTPPMEKTRAAVVTQHENMLGPVLKQAVSIGLTPPDFQRLAARLALSVEALDVEQNGLGYNNLIYMAVVLGELSLNPDAAYKALIVEEPEAHLHPQLQAVLLQYLQSKEVPAAGEKAVQVFVTSHSPNFASIASLDSIGCVHQSVDGAKAFFPRDVAFDKTKKEKLQRYLDVTRAELFFARCIIFVEGTAELFLVRAMATRLKVDLRKQSISILSTEGLNFDCFLPLFGEKSLNIRAAVITDADPPGKYPHLDDTLCLSDAASSIFKSESNYVKPFFALKTLEYDLALHEDNQARMLTALEELHPDIGKNLRSEVEAAKKNDRAKVLFSGMFERSEGKNIQKGKYAQALAQVILSDGAKFVVPNYIKHAIEFVTKD